MEAVGEGLYFETWRRVQVPVETGESDDTLLFNRAKLGLCDRAHNKGSLHGFHNPRSLPWTDITRIAHTEQFTLAFYQATLSQITRAEFHSNLGEAICVSPTVSKGQVKVVWEKETLGYTPTLQDYMRFS